ncbi:MAG: class I SAM-dependent methyltransferase [Ignavibacteria bacterium]|nr:class I SAM-dependent methyltransferase [Ignavibacteria bacterium]
MGNTKEHYDNHLSRFYSWMTGDIETSVSQFREFLKQYGVEPKETRRAADLGAGNGIQTLALTAAGFEVTAIDFCYALLCELKARSTGTGLRIICDDIRNFARYCDSCDAILCCGDTLTHLESIDEVTELLISAYGKLNTGGKLILTFRDYTEELTGTDRFIHVKSDANHILTCVLDYDDAYVNVTDLFYELNENVWSQSAGTYRKLRIPRGFVAQTLSSAGFGIILNDVSKGMIRIIAEKV